jgi:hypothetical protein
MTFLVVICYIMYVIFPFPGHNDIWCLRMRVCFCLLAEVKDQSYNAVLCQCHSQTSLSLVQFYT